MTQPFAWGKTVIPADSAGSINKFRNYALGGCQISERKWEWKADSFGKDTDFTLLRTTDSVTLKVRGTIEVLPLIKP